MEPSFIEEYRVSDFVSKGLMTIAQKAKDHRLLRPGRVGNSGKIVSKIKSCLECNISDIPPVLFDSEDDSVLEKYIQHVFDCIRRYAELYMDRADLCPTGPPKIQWYGPGEAYFAEHFDNGYEYNDREVAFITYLNTPVDGGGTRFIHQKTTIKPEKGKTILFPAGYTHKHCGVVSETSDKIILTGWFKFLKNVL